MGLLGYSFRKIVAGRTANANGYLLNLGSSAKKSWERWLEVQVEEASIARSGALIDPLCQLSRFLQSMGSGVMEY